MTPVEFVLLLVMPSVVVQGKAKQTKLKIRHR